MTTPQRRGRPRSTGDKHCDRCDQMAAKIRVHWSDGAICGACFTTAARTHGRCHNCHQQRLVPGRDADGHPLCRDCAGITTNLTCDTCGGEAERVRDGSCTRCVLRVDLAEILKPDTDLRLKRLIEILATSRRPESIRTWMRGKTASELLQRLGNRELELTHEAFDAFPDSVIAAGHLRDLLTHHHVLPQVTDKNLAGFERWLTRRLDTLKSTPEIHGPIEQFARWHHLKRLRTPTPGRNIITATLNARQEITEAGKFLTWLRETHGLSCADLQQAHVDEYIAGGSSTRKHVRNFLHWLNRTQHPRRRVTTTYRKAVTTPLITQDERVQLVGNCLAFEQAQLSTRIAALIHLLWAQPLNRITQLTIDVIDLQPSTMRIHLGTTASDIPEQLTELFWRHLDRESSRQATNTGTRWLFPGYRAGHPIHPRTLSERFITLGINPQRVRNTTLRELTQQLDARSLADLLHYSPKTMAQHAARGGAPMSNYIDLKRPD